MARLQIVIEEDVNEILEKLSRKSDKTLFVEIAIKKAYQNKAIKELFSWTNQDKPKVSKEMEPVKPKSKKVKFDEEFN